MKMILAIDPGPSQSSVVRWQHPGQIVSAQIIPNRDVLLLLETANISGHVSFAIEMVGCYGMAVGREVFETCLWIGRFVQRAEDNGMPVQYVFRKDVKIHFCQSMRAKDANIRQALIDRFGSPGTKKLPGTLYGVHSHEWSALAVAVYASDNPQPQPDPNGNATA